MDDVRSRLLAALGREAGSSSDFDLNPGISVPKGRPLRPAAVLVSVFVSGDGAKVLLTKRSSALAHHPGQVAFPGGKVDETDSGVVEAALREAKEEVGLPPDRVEVLGQLSNHITVTAYDVTPVVALVEGPFEPVCEPGEVEEAFFVPIDHLVELERFVVEGRRWQGTKRHYYAVPWGPYYVWGATARILRGLADRMTREG